MIRGKELSKIDELTPLSRHILDELVLITHSTVLIVHAAPRGDLKRQKNV